MSSTPKPAKPQGASFLPEDYRRRKSEGRSGVIMFGLFCVVMCGVVGAFFVTNRQWSAVRSLQEQINVQYAAEAKKIEQLKVLEAQKQEMVSKAEITTMLLEKVPRSNLMAELINRMPPELTLTELDLTGKRIVETPPDAPKGKPAPRSLSGKSSASKAPPKTAAKPAKKDPEKPPERPKPPKFEYTLVLMGLSRTDEEIADYTASLQKCGLLDKVEFKYSGDVIVEEVALRKFRIEASIKPTADARLIEPLHVQRSDTRGVIPGVADNVLQRKGLGKIKSQTPGKSPRETAIVPEK